MTRRALSLVRLTMSHAAYTLEPYALVPLPGKGIHADSSRSKRRPHLQGLCDVYVESLHDAILHAHSF